MLLHIVRLTYRLSTMQCDTFITEMHLLETRRYEQDHVSTTLSPQHVAAVRISFYLDLTVP